MEMVKLSYLWPPKTSMPDILNEIDATHANLVNLSRSTMERTRTIARDYQLKTAAGFDASGGAADTEIVENVFDVSRDDVEKQFRLSMGKLNTRKSLAQQSGSKLSKLCQDELGK